jgi:WD40 repeat protein
MWDLATQTLLYATPDKKFSAYQPDDVTDFWINRADFSPDGSLLALPLEVWQGPDPYPGYIVLLDPQTGDEILAFQAHEGAIQDATFSHDGTLLASTGGTDGQTVIWDVASTLATGAGQSVSRLCCHDGWIWSANFSPDDSRVVTAADDGMKVWDVASGTELFTVASGDASEALFSADAQYILAAGEDAILTYQAESGELHATTPSGGGSFHVMQFSPDGSRLAGSTYDSRVWVWSYAEGEFGPEPIVLSGHKGFAGGIAFSQDGRYLFSASSDGTVRQWDISPDGASELGAYAHAARAYDVAFSPDGSWLVSTSLDGSAKIWDVAERKVRHTLYHEDWVVGVDVHPDGHTLATSSNDGTIRFWDAQTGEELMVIRAHEVGQGYFAGAKGIAYSPDGERLASGGGADGALRVWDTTSGQMLMEAIPNPGYHIYAVDYSPDGRWLVSAGNHGTIKVWDPGDLHEVTTLSGDGSTIWEATFSPDSTRLVTGHGSARVHVWSFPGPEEGPDARPELLYKFQHSEGSLGRGDFSPNGKLLAVTGPKRTTLHDAETGELLLDLGHPASRIVFSPDGRMVATTGWDGTVRILTVYPEDLLALAQTRVTRSLTEAECQQYLHMDSCPG